MKGQSKRLLTVDYTQRGKIYLQYSRKHNAIKPHRKALYYILSRTHHRGVVWREGHLGNHVAHPPQRQLQFPGAGTPHAHHLKRIYEDKMQR